MYIKVTLIITYLYIVRDTQNVTYGALQAKEIYDEEVVIPLISIRKVQP